MVSLKSALHFWWWSEAPTRNQRTPESTLPAHSRTYQQEGGTDVTPTQSPEQAGPMSDHHLDVVREPVHAVHPADSRGFDEHHEQYGDAWAKHVQQRDQVNSALNVTKLLLFIRVTIFVFFFFFHS